MGLSERRKQLFIKVAAGVVLGSTVLFGCQTLIGLSEYTTGPGDSGSGDGGPQDAREQDAAKDVIEPPPLSKPAKWANFKLSCNPSTEGCFTKNDTSFAGTVNNIEVTDAVTGRVWQGDATSAASFEAAVVACKNGRLPTRIELVALMESTGDGAATKWILPAGFREPPDRVSRYWTASPAWPFVEEGQRFWSVNPTSMEVVTGLPQGNEKWGVLCILR